MTLPSTIYDFIGSITTLTAMCSYDIFPAENANFYKNRSNFVQSFQLISHITAARLDFAV